MLSSEVDISRRDSWNARTQQEKQAYLDGFVDGWGTGVERLGILIGFQAMTPEQRTGFLDLRAKYARAFRLLLELVDLLYSDPANDGLGFVRAVRFSVDRRNGEDISKSLRAARQLAREMYD